MNLRIITVLIAALAAMAIYITVRLFRKDRLTTRMFLAWFLLWFSIGIFSLFPTPIQFAINLLAMGDRLVFMFVASILALFMVVFYLSARIAETERKLTKLVQEIAILDYQLEKLKNKKVEEEEGGNDE